MTEIQSDGPEALLRAAEILISRPDAKTRGLWPRAASHLCRQALEAGLRELWKERLPGLERLSFRAQLGCLPTYLDDAALAGAVSYAWSALSRACHHHVYELAPTSAELEMWIETVRRLTRTG